MEDGDFIHQNGFSFTDISSQPKTLQQPLLQLSLLEECPQGRSILGFLLPRLDKQLHLQTMYWFLALMVNGCWQVFSSSCFQPPKASARVMDFAVFLPISFLHRPNIFPATTFSNFYSLDQTKIIFLMHQRRNCTLASFNFTQERCSKPYPSLASAASH